MQPRPPHPGCRTLLDPPTPPPPFVLALWPSKCQLAFPPNKGWYFSSVLRGDFPLSPSPR